jgi:LPS-assembly protein
VQANYNFDCCGVSLEFRRFQFGATVRDERQFRVAITFANIGTFGNLKKQERMF